MNDVFTEIKNLLPMQDVAKFYGLEINRSGMACCPFHDDKTPSLKIYPDHFYCFGCGETGDATGFVAKLFGITQLEAAKKISSDFGLNLFNGEIAVPIKIRENPNAEYYAWLKSAKADVSAYVDKMDEWRERYRPQNPLVSLHPHFVESLKKGYAEYLLEILDYGTDKEKRDLFEVNKADIAKIHDRLEKITIEERVTKRKAI